MAAAGPGREGIGQAHLGEPYRQHLETRNIWPGNNIK